MTISVTRWTLRAWELAPHVLLYQRQKAYNIDEDMEKVKEIEKEMIAKGDFVVNDGPIYNFLRVIIE